MKYAIEHESESSYERVTTVVTAESLPDAVEKLLEACSVIGKKDIFSVKQHLEVKELDEDGTLAMDSLA